MSSTKSPDASTTIQPRHVVATGPLYIGTALAHNAGDLVLQETVEPNGWTEDVATLGTKAADKAMGVGDAPPAG